MARDFACAAAWSWSLRLARIAWAGHPGFSRDAELKHGIHGGSVETSIMLHVRPDLVDMAAAKNSGIAVRAFLWRPTFDILTPEGAIGFGWAAQDLNPDGACGNALDADAERGRLVVDHAARNFAALLAEVDRFPSRASAIAPEARDTRDHPSTTRTWTAARDVEDLGEGDLQLLLDGVAQALSEGREDRPLVVVTYREDEREPEFRAIVGVQPLEPLVLLVAQPVEPGARLLGHRRLGHRTGAGGLAAQVGMGAHQRELLLP